MRDMDVQNVVDDMALDDVVTSNVRIVAVHGSDAFIESDMSSTCGGCSMSKGCSTKALASLFANRQVPLAIANDFGGLVGDRIQIGLASTTIVKVAALTYVFPLIGLLFGALLGDALQWHAALPLILGIIGLVLGFYVSRSYYVSERVAASIRPVFIKKLATLYKAPCD